MLLVFIWDAIIDPHNIGGYRRLFGGYWRLSEAIGGLIRDYSGGDIGGSWGVNPGLIGDYSGTTRGLLGGI